MNFSITSRRLLGARGAGECVHGTVDGETRNAGKR
jgi:hypothetical protein